MFSFSRVVSRNFGRAASRGLATYKTSTGMVGISVDPNGRVSLINSSSKVLAAVQKIPAGVAYREQVEQLYGFFKKSAEENEDIKTIESVIGYGQIEELLLNCEDEISLIDYYHDNKVWEQVAEIQAHGKVVADHFLSDAVYKKSVKEDNL